MITDRATQPATAGPRILLVDDEAKIRGFIGRALSAAGYAIDCCAGGEEAVRRIGLGEYGLVLVVGRLQADIGEGPIALTRLEFLLLEELMEHVGQSVRKDQLLASIWGYDFDPGSNVVDVCVRRLRSKLGFGLIKTVRGAGYQLA